MDFNWYNVVFVDLKVSALCAVYLQQLEKMHPLVTNNMDLHCPLSIQTNEMPTHTRQYFVNVFIKRKTKHKYWCE